MADSGRSRSGKARAESLTPEERRAIATKGATERWSVEVKEAICGAPDRPLRIGGAELQAYVLEDGTRVLTQAEFLEALGRHRKANVRNVEGEEHIPPILQGNGLKPFIDNDLIEKSQPIKFRTPQGLRASGYRAEILPLVCEVYLKARDAGQLAKQQQHIAVQADILVRGLARVGIIALVDEATGYQEMRSKDALARILEAFIDKELQAWVQTFPAEFYNQMFRLRGLKFPSDSVKRPQYFGHLTNDVVYKRIAPGVLEELKRVTPKDENGRRSHKYFQRLTSNVGYPKLREHLGAVVAIMKMSKDWPDFMQKINQHYPPLGENLSLPFTDLDGGDTGTGL